MPLRYPGLMHLPWNEGNLHVSEPTGQDQAARCINIAEHKHCLSERKEYHKTPITINTKQ